MKLNAPLLACAAWLCLATAVAQPIPEATGPRAIAPLSDLSQKPWSATLGLQIRLDKSAWSLETPETSCPLSYLVAFSAPGIQLASCHQNARGGTLALGLLSVRQTATDRTTRLEFRIDRNFF